MALIPEMNLAEFQSLDENEVRCLESIILTDLKGNYLAALIVPQTDFLKTQAEYIGEISNGVRPKGPTSY